MKFFSKIMLLLWSVVVLGSDIGTVHKLCSSIRYEKSMSEINRALQDLLDKKISINAYSESGNTTVIWAARRGNLQALELLIQNGGDVHLGSGIFTDGERNFSNKEHFKNLTEDHLLGANCLHWAVMEGHEEVVTYLIDEKGMDPYHTTTNGYNAFELLALTPESNQNNIKLMLDKNSALLPLGYNLPLELLLSILSYVPRWGKTKLAEFQLGLESVLILNKDIKAGLNNILLEYMKNKIVDIPNLFLEDITFSGEFWVLPFLNHEQVEDLVKKNGNRNLRRLVLNNKPRGEIRYAMRLVKNYQLINKINEYGNTPVIWASRRGELPVLKLLIQNGGDVHLGSGIFTGGERNFSNKEHFKNLTEDHLLGANALHWAVMEGRCEVVKYLIEEIHMDPYQTTANGYNAFDLLVLTPAENHNKIMPILERCRANHDTQ